MAKAVKGDEFDTLIGLGNGYDTSVSGEYALLLGGGVGVPPLYNLCKKLISENKKVTVKLFTVIIRYVAPVCLVAILISSILDVFGIFKI